MGGKAFAQPGPNGEPALYTPRMPPEVYFALRDHYGAILKRFYKDVATSPEGPGKADYGDVDFIVSRPLSTSLREDTATAADPESTDPAEISTLFKAFGAKREYLGGFAVPISPALTAQSLGPATPDITNNQGDTEADTTQAYAQIDVNKTKPETFEWVIFHKSYGDMWQIIGFMIRNYGLTATHEGLFARIAAIEEESAGYASKVSFYIFLTRDPDVVMEFLGLDVATYRRGFSTEAEVFEWVARCPLFDREIFLAASREADAKRARDRARLRKRPMYQRFVWEFAAQAPPPAAELPTREQIFDKAVAFFDVSRKRDEMLASYYAREKERRLWSAISKSIPLEGTHLNLAMRGLRRWVVFERANSTATDGNEEQNAEQGPAMPSISDAPNMEPSSHAIWTSDPRRETEALLEWVRHNWQEVKALERQREKRDAAARKLGRLADAAAIEAEAQAEMEAEDKAGEEAGRGPVTNGSATSGGVNEAQTAPTSVEPAEAS